MNRIGVIEEGSINSPPCITLNFFREMYAGILNKKTRTYHESLNQGNESKKAKKKEYFQRVVFYLNLCYFYRGATKIISKISQKK